MIMPTRNNFSKICISLIALLVLAGTLPAVANAAKADRGISPTKFSNVIIFGDSLSDLGDFPDSKTMFGGVSVSGIFWNLYVPIGNPVNPAKDRILPGLHLRFPPINGGTDLFKVTLPRQQELCANENGQSNCVERQYRSINWTEYLVYNGVLRGLFAPRADLRPWIKQYEEPSPSIRQSVNYAYGGALSNGDCTNCDQDQVSCTVGSLSLQESVFQRQSEYRNLQTTDDPNANIALRSKVIVPALRKQIEMFTEDLKSGRVQVNKDTLYIVFSGSNDIGSAFEDFVDNQISFADFLEALSFTIPREIAGRDKFDSAVNLLRSPIIGAKHILVLGQYNLGLTPELISDANVDGLLPRHAVAAAFNQLFNLYNGALQRRISDFRSDTVQYVDIQTPIGNAAESFFVGFRRGYFFTIGDQCVEATSSIIQQGEAASCFTRKDVPIPIGFWNDAHLSTQYYQLLAAAVLDTFSPGQFNQIQGNGFADRFSPTFGQQELEVLFTRWFRR